MIPFSIWSPKMQYMIRELGYPLAHSLVFPLNILGFTQITKDELCVQLTFTPTVSHFLAENRDLIVADAKRPIYVEG
jgi:hypothetical protein